MSEYLSGSIHKDSIYLFIFSKRKMNKTVKTETVNGKVTAKTSISSILFQNYSLLTIAR